jgi:hypothetical protein
MNIHNDKIHKLFVTCQVLATERLGAKMAYLQKLKTVLFWTTFLKNESEGYEITRQICLPICVPPLISFNQLVDLYEIP